MKLNKNQHITKEGVVKKNPKKRVTYKSTVNSFAEGLIGEFNSEINEAMSKYGSEAEWKIDKFLPDSREISQDLMDSSPIEDKEKFAEDVLDKFNKLRSKYIEKNYQNYYIEEEESEFAPDERGI